MILQAGPPDRGPQSVGNPRHRPPWIPWCSGSGPEGKAFSAKVECRLVI